MPYIRKRKCPNCEHEANFKETKADNPGDMYPGEYIDHNGKSEYYCDECEFMFDEEGNTY